MFPQRLELFFLKINLAVKGSKKYRELTEVVFPSEITLKYHTFILPENSLSSIREPDNLTWENTKLTLSWRGALSYRNQSIDLKSKSIDWFLYDNGPRHERVKKNIRKHTCSPEELPKWYFREVCKVSNQWSLV